MLDHDTARALAIRYIENRDDAEEHDLMLDDRYTVERPTLFAFSFNPRAFVEHGDEMAILVGSGPLIVDRLTGEVHPTGSAHSTEYWIEKYERQ